MTLLRHSFAKRFNKFHRFQPLLFWFPRAGVGTDLVCSGVPFFWFPRAGVGTDLVFCFLVPTRRRGNRFGLLRRPVFVGLRASRDVGTSRMRSHAGAWERENAGAWEREIYFYFNFLGSRTHPTNPFNICIGRIHRQWHGVFYGTTGNVERVNTGIAGSV